MATIGSSQNISEVIQNTNEKVDTYIMQQMKEQNIPGVAVAVMQKEKVLYSKAFGFSNLEHQIPANPNTAFAIASISKSLQQ